MAVGKGARGPLWARGEFTARLRGPAPSPARTLRLRRPFALIGRLPGADIRIDDPRVEPRHALLLLDRRGIFGVDLLSDTGTRFAGAASGSAWLGAGDILEVAGHRVEFHRLRVDGEAIDPPLCSDDLLAEAGPESLTSITLEPLDSAGPPWMLGSALAFVGRGPACAIRVENASASETHCALLRGPTDAHVIDLLGRRTLLNDRPVDGALALVDGDILTVGEARFAVRIEPASGPVSGLPARIPAGSEVVPVAAGATILSWLEAARSEDSPRDEILGALRQFQADTATLLGAQIERIESLNREIAALRAEIRGRRGPSNGPASPLRIDPAPASARGSSAESAAWLLDRLQGLEDEGRSTWKDLLGRITAIVQPRPTASHDAGAPKSSLLRHLGAAPSDPS